MGGINVFKQGGLDSWVRRIGVGPGIDVERLVDGTLLLSAASQGVASIYAKDGEGAAIEITTLQFPQGSIDFDAGMGTISFPDAATTLGGLADVSTAGAVTRHAIMYNGTSWVSRALQAADIGSGILGVERGGTGIASPVAGRLLLGAGTNAMTLLEPGAAGNVVRSIGTGWTAGTLVWNDINKASSSLEDIVDRSILHTTGTLPGGRVGTHLHDAGDITGAFLPQQGGTGFTTLPGGAQILYATSPDTFMFTTGGNLNQVLGRTGMNAVGWVNLPTAPSLAHGRFPQRVDGGAGPVGESAFSLPVDTAPDGATLRANINGNVLEWWNITPAGIGAAASTHTHSWAQITSGKPTTLAGYGITDAAPLSHTHSQYLHGNASSPNDVGPHNFAIGNTGVYNFIQSHGGQTLALNPFGNPVTVLGNIVTTTGNIQSHLNVGQQRIGINTGSWGSVSVGGNTNGWAGFRFTDWDRWFMVDSQYQGIITTSNWQWRWNNGVLDIGTVPAARISGGSFQSGHYVFPNTLTTNEWLQGIGGVYAGSGHPVGFNNDGDIMRFRAGGIDSVARLFAGGTLETNGQGRFKGWNTGGTGKALEVGFTADVGYIMSWDRSGSGYWPLGIEVSTAYLRSVNGLEFRNTAGALAGCVYYGGSSFGLLTAPSASWAVECFAGGGQLYGKWTVGGNLHFSEVGRGVVGIYNHLRYQAVYAMGDAYKLADDGTTPGTLYGIAWAYKVGGLGTAQAKEGLIYQALFMNNGITQTAIGTGIWTVGSATIGGSVIASGQISAGAGAAVTGDAHVSGDVYVQSTRVAKVIISAAVPSGSAPIGTLWIRA